MLLVALGLLSLNLAFEATGKGTDVYLFLFGMMLLSEVGRREGLFDWVAVLAVNHAQGSPRKLFLLVYLVGAVITAFLSNDATAVVLTPAVFAVAKKAKTAPLLPLLFVFALIANAASFVLPISNPANIVLYGNHTPALGAWLMRFTVPSVLSIVATYVLLRWTQRSELAGTCEANLEPLELSSSGRVALAGIGVTAVVQLAVSAFDVPLGLPTAILGVLTALVVLIQERKSPLPMIREISWSVLPLVAALFVLVEMFDHTGVIATLAAITQQGA
ncbi:MAG: putative anion permease [uncultured Paraburkholderia sp.]|nr:MAG: putative anion permease [uncultured Paraburkholderia sp.]CAH2919638.1 MAG: putative anion permease [uncultured Paraburkholderia sp.]